MARRHYERLDIRIRDDGPGLPEGSQTALRTGVGLANTEARLEQLYGSNHRFDLRNRPEGGLEVALEIPFRLRPESPPAGSPSALRSEEAPARSPGRPAPRREHSVRRASRARPFLGPRRLKQEAPQWCVQPTGLLSGELEGNAST